MSRPHISPSPSLASNNSPPAPLKPLPLQPCGLYLARARRVLAAADIPSSDISSALQSIDENENCTAIDAFTARAQIWKTYIELRKYANAPKKSVIDWYRQEVREAKEWQNETTAKMPSSCADIRAALAACLQSSDCVMVQRNKPSDCLRPPLLETMPTKCQQLKKGYGDCKRGMVDMRKRFRGNQPISMAKEGGEAEKGMLYAGKPAFKTVKETSGDEPEKRDWREVENERLREGK